MFFRHTVLPYTSYIISFRMPKEEFITSISTLSSAGLGCKIMSGFVNNRFCIGVLFSCCSATYPGIQSHIFGISVYVISLPKLSKIDLA